MELHRDILEGPVNESAPESRVVDAVFRVRAVGVHFPHGGDDPLFAVNGRIGGEGQFDGGTDDGHQRLAPDRARWLIVQLLRSLDVDVGVARF